MEALLDRRWRTLNDESVADVRATLRAVLAGEQRLVHVGTDSQQHKKFTDYVTVLVVQTPSKGARAFFCKERVPRIRSLRERLWKEVALSTTLAMELTQTPDMGGAPLLDELQHDLLIHIDANPDEQHKSSEYVKELAGLAVGMGFRYVLKPDSWVATHAADHVVKSAMVGG